LNRNLKSRPSPNIGSGGRSSGRPNGSEDNLGGRPDDELNSGPSNRPSSRLNGDQMMDLIINQMMDPIVNQAVNGGPGGNLDGSETIE